MNIKTDIKSIVNMILENHGTIAEAHRRTGVSPSYFSRIKSGDLQPKSVSPDIYEKLLKGLTISQRESVGSEKPNKPQIPEMTNKEISTWVKNLTPRQREGLITIIEMIPH